MNVRIDTPENSIPNDEWTHVAAVWQSGSRFEVYINGVLSVTQSAPSGSLNIPFWYIGTADPERSDRSFDGKLDDVALWNRALSSDEISTVFLSQIPRVEPDPDAVGEASPHGLICDSLRDWGHEDEPGKAWTYASEGRSFSELTADSLNNGWEGGELQIKQYSATEGPRVGQFVMEPSDDRTAIKRWTSHVRDNVAIQYEVQRLSLGGNGVDVR